MFKKQNQIINAFKTRAEKISSYTVRDNKIKFTQRKPEGDYKGLKFDDTGWEEIELPFNWDTKNDAWFRKELVVPEEIEGISVEGSDLKIRGRSVWANPVLNIHTVLYIDGKEALTADNYMDFSFRQEVSTKVKAGEEHIIAIHTEGKEGVVAFYSALPLIEIHYSEVDKVAFELQSFVEELRYAQSLPKGRQLLEKAVKGIESETIEAISFNEILKVVNDIRKKISPLKKEAKKYNVHLIGHAHIDMNWLWPMEETIDVCKNTFTTVNSLMDRYKDFCFSQSQAFTYSKVEEKYPELFNSIKERYKEGRWNITASSWVELDLNLSNEEAIVRQILYAKKYIEEKFNYNPRVFWAPDTFGHPWSMPQILKKSGIDYYYFMRASRREHDLFWWEAPDGSRVLVYNSSYLGNINPNVLVEQAIYSRNYLKDTSSMFLYGVGDHGGGPTAEDIEMIYKLKQKEVYPNLEFSTTHKYFDITSKKRKDLPTIKDEFNPIFDGCYTSHWDTKVHNRRCERLSLIAECIGSISKLLGGSYPDLSDIWKTTLFNQFHDILPGSAIQPSYEYSNKIAQEAENNAENLISDCANFIANQIDMGNDLDNVLVFNTLTWKRNDIVYVKLNGKQFSSPVAEDQSGNIYPAQVVGDEICFVAQDVPPMGYKVFTIKNSSQTEGKSICKDLNMENEFFKLKLDKDTGTISYLYDKKNKREIMKDFTSEGAFPVDTFPLKLEEDFKLNIHSSKPFYNNMLQVLLEKPHPMSAWVIGAISRVENLIDNPEIEVIEEGPVLGRVRIKNKYDQSDIVQEISMYRMMDRLDIKTVLNWNQKADDENLSPMLKASFTPILGNTTATYDIPFGKIERAADGREYPAQKFVDISDNEYGLSILSDTKSGFDVKGNTVRITMIRTSYEPDPDPDRGVHDFIYSIYPHKGSFTQGNTIKRGYELNFPLVACNIPKEKPGGQLSGEKSFLEVSGDNLVVTSFKKAEENNDMILRVYESKGKNSRGKISLGFDVEGVEESDLMEKPLPKSKAIIKNGQIIFDLKPFEIKTFRLKL